MATGVGMGFDVSKLINEFKRLDAELARIQEKGVLFGHSMTNIFTKLPANEVTDFTARLMGLKKEIVNLGKDKTQIMNLDHRTFSKVVDEANEILRIIKLIQAESKKGGYKKLVNTHGLGKTTKELNQIAQGQKSVEGALKYAKNINTGVKSINSMQRALYQLQKAQSKVNLNTFKGAKDYRTAQREIDKLRRELKKLEGDQDRVSTGAGNLHRAIAAAFSVSAIKGYVNKLMQVRGEFELQQRSLQVLLQNKDEANALWDKTVALAVKSPLTTKQLVTATKQLAAYRVESDKLFETNRMLADVSQGLGVDMNRLILAFGQVKAANFLRGTELRQFSEAGVNMLDELAKRFTALEGRAVSVGEVFERVSKRMVSFSDVEAVFKTITSEGGIFYKMQEKQSETLKGMMLNLKDSYELMLNDIGKGNEGILKGFVSFMKTLVEGWREAAVVIKTAGTIMLFYFAASKIAKIGSAFSGLWSIMATNPIGAIAAGIGAIIGLVVSLSQHTNKLKEALSEVEKNATENLEESIGLYRKLTDTINDSTASLDERNKAYEELKTKFKDILPDQQLELKYIQSLKFSYEDAEKAMFAYYNAKAIQQKKDKIEFIYEDDFDRDTKDIIQQIKKNIDSIDSLDEEQKTRMKSGVSSAVYSAVDELKRGVISDKSLVNDGLAAVAENLVHKIEDNLKNYSGDYVQLLNSWVHRNAQQLAKTAEKYTEAMRDVEGLSFETAAQREAYNAMQEHNKEMENAISLYKHLVSLRQKLADNKVDLTSDKSTLNEEQLQDREWYLNDLNNTLNEINKLSPEVANGIKDIDKSLLSAAEKGSYEFAKSLGVAENALYNIFADKAKTLKGGDEGASAMLSNFAEEIKSTADSKLSTPLQKAIISAFDKAITDKSLSQKGKDLLAKTLPDEKQSTGDVRKNVEALLTQYQDEVKKWENSKKAGGEQLPFVEYLNKFGDAEFKSAMGMFLGSDEELNELQQKVIPVLEHIDRLLGGDPDKKKKGRRDLVDERLKVIKEIYKAYKELNKTFDETTSKTGAIEKFGDAFYAAFEKTPEQMGYNLFTAEGVVDAYNKFIETLSKADDITKGNLAKGEFVMELQVEMQQKKNKDFNDQIEKMFSGYELAIELDKLNVPRDFAEQLFGVDTFDLSTIRSKIEDELFRLKTQGGGKDQIKKMEDFLKKVDDMELKDKERRLKELVKYMRKEQDIRIKLKLEEINKLKDIDESNATEQQKLLLKSNVTREYAQKLKKAEWDEFTKTPYIVQMFDDLDSVGTQALENLGKKLESLKDDLYSAGLPASELKEILDKINKVEDELNERNPFRGLSEGFKNVFGGLAQARKEYERQLEQQETADKFYKAAINEYNKFNEKNGEFGGDERERTRLEVQLRTNKQYAEQMQKTTDEVAENYTDAAKSVALLGKRISSAVELTQQLAQSAIDIADSFGAFSEKGSKEVADSAMSILSGVGGLAQAGIKMASGDWFGGITSAVTSIAQLIIGINQTGDAMKQMKIEKELKLVQTLEKQYEKLEKAMESAYSIDYIKQYNQEMMDSLDQQIEARNRMIALEESKKKSDKEAINGYKDEIDDLLEKRDEAEKEYLQKLGGIGGETEYGDIISDFVDAWLDGFLEVGDGLDALNEHFDDFIKNIVSKQLAARVVSSSLQGILTHIDKSIANDGIFDKDEWTKLLKQKEEVLPQLNEALSQILEEFGATEWAGKQKELGSLSAGIQGMSAEQADILAAYWSSSRFLLSTIDNNVRTITENLGINAEVENPMLPHLRAISEQTRAIRDMFESVIGRGGNNKHGGAYLKVDIG